jgi:hypothetical protein
MKLRGTLGMLALGAVAAVAALEGWQQFRQGDATVAQQAARGVAPPTRAGSAPLPLADRLSRGWLSGEASGDPFGAREAPRPGARQAPRPFVAAAPAPAPVAAPFPYLYAGQLSLKDGKRHVYLMKGNDLVPINVGDVLDGVFKVTAIAAAEFEVVHLPSATTRVIQYASLGTGSTLAQGEPAPLPTHAGAPVSSAPGSQAAGSSTGGAADFGAPVMAGSSPASPAPSSTASSGSVRSGSVPTGQLGSSGPAAGAPALGVAPTASGSMPVSPAPAGIMQTLPAPTGRLGV